MARRSYGKVKNGMGTSYSGICLPFIPLTGDISDYFDLDTGLGISGSSCSSWKLLENQSGRFERGYGESGEDSGDLLTYSTAENSSLYTDKDTHTHTTVDRYVYKVVRSSANDNDDGGTYDQDGYDKIGVENGYNDSITVNWNTYGKTTTSASHSHTLSGGDGETRPNCVVCYFIIRL